MKWYQILIYILNQVIGSIVDRLTWRKRHSRETLNHQDCHPEGENYGTKQERTKVQVEPGICTRCERRVQENSRQSTGEAKKVCGQATGHRSEDED